MSDWREDVKESLKTEEEIIVEQKAQDKEQKQAAKKELLAVTQSMVGWLKEAQLLFSGRVIENPIFSAKKDMGILQCSSHSLGVELCRDGLSIEIKSDDQLTDVIIFSIEKKRFVLANNEACIDLERYFGGYIKKFAEKVKRSA